ncbi:sensor histidine kinase [Butyrivibrio sp. VCB2006]|uniref:sensor histidine kinase n=1 Tax=Butyrivibrio sp. VCB2006 TaxID=1280679 RepID=UPI0009DBCD03|nr:sensor histidine kinase [Butyrivibrio sp. VCB2006]
MTNKDLRDMTLRDMEEYTPRGRSRGRERARNMSIKYKIASITILVALIPMVVLTVLMLFFYNRAIMQRADKQIEENIRIMSDRLSSVLQNGELCSNNLTIEFGNYYNDKSMKQVTRDSKVTSQLSQSLLVYNGISSIVFIDRNGRFYSTNPAFNDESTEIKYSNYVYELSEANGKTVIMDPMDNPFNREGKEVITMGKHVINIVTGTHLGYLFINMNKNYLIESSQSEISYYFLYDSSSNVITESEVKDPIYADEEFAKSLLNTDEKLIEYQNESYLFARDRIDKFDLTVVGITNLNKFNVTGKDFRFILLTTGSFTAVLLFISVWFSANFVTKPLKVLHDGAEQIAEGDMSIRFRFKTKDEIGRLGRIFNYMTQRNKELLQQVDDEAKKKREYELALIQEQVKPHFLYNTLDIIIMLIEMNRSKEAARVTHKLANYYKNSLSGSEEIVSIEREIQIIRDYLDLQTMRYGDKFSYEIDVDEAVFKSQIPKMTLQPLVENAIYHGIKNKSSWGKITVKGRFNSGNDEKSYVELKVIDDGIGMPQAELSKLNELLSKEEPFDNDERKKAKEAEITDHDSTKGGSHFGLYSVAKRIKLYFGKEYGAGIESIEGVGTTVIVTVPYSE